MYTTPLSAQIVQTVPKHSTKLKHAHARTHARTHRYTQAELTHACGLTLCHAPAHSDRQPLSHPWALQVRLGLRPAKAVPAVGAAPVGRRRLQRTARPGPGRPRAKASTCAPTAPDQREAEEEDRRQDPDLATIPAAHRTRIEGQTPWVWRCC